MWALMGDFDWLAGWMLWAGGLLSVGRWEIGCGCECEEKSACLDCCEEGSARQIRVELPEGLFEDGEFCAGCEGFGGEVFLNNFTVLHPCDWLLVDTENVCGGASTSVSYGVGVRKDTPEEGKCEVRFRMGITCSGFVSFYDWTKVVNDGEVCGELELEYEGALDDGTCCEIEETPGNVTVNFNP